MLGAGLIQKLTPDEERKARDADLKANRADKKAGRSFLLADVPGPKCGPQGNFSAAATVAAAAAAAACPSNVA